MYSGQLNNIHTHNDQNDHPFHIVTNIKNDKVKIVKFETTFNNDISTILNNTPPPVTPDNFSNSEKTHDGFILSLYPYLNKDPYLLAFSNSIKDILESNNFSHYEKNRYIDTGRDYILKRFKEIFNNKDGKVIAMTTYSNSGKIDVQFLDPDIKTFILLREIINNSNIANNKEKTIIKKAFIESNYGFIKKISQKLRQ